jgi:hypothetical protein
MGHKYNPLQARDRHGRWVAKAGNAAFNVAAKSATVGAGKKAPIKVVNAKRGDRGAGFKGLKQNTIPYVRVNKRSQTIGVNAGTIIPGTHKRVVFGGYSRLESTRNKTAVDRFAAKGVSKVFPTGTRRGKAVAYARKNFSITNPAVRGSVGGAQVRLGTSRGAGPTVIVRRGRHKTAQSKSQVGIQKYDTAIRKISGTRAAKVKKPRPQRRNARRRR